MTGIELRPWADDDLATLQRSNTAEMTEYLGGPESAEALVARHERYLRLGREGAAHLFRIVTTAHPEGIGSIGYWRREFHGEAVLECGWAVETAHQGRGYATVALLALIAAARAAGETGQLWAYPHVVNEASNAICRKAGFRLDGQEEFEYPPGHWERSNCWVLELGEAARA